MPSNTYGTFGYEELCCPAEDGLSALIHVLINPNVWSAALLPPDKNISLVIVSVAYRVLLGGVASSTPTLFLSQLDLGPAIAKFKHHTDHKNIW